MKRYSHFAVMTYSFLKKYKFTIFVAFAAIFVASFYLTLNMKVTQNIEIMLPDSWEGLDKHYKLLQNSPLTKKIVITISNNNGALDETIDILAENLATASVNGRPVFRNIVKGPPQETGLRIFSEITSLLPNVITDEDVVYLESLRENGTVDKIMSKNIAHLSSPAWLGYKKIIENDPLGLYVLFFKKMQSSASLMNVSIDGARFKSSDGTHGLIMAEQADELASFTSVENAAEIMTAYENAAANLPSGSESFIVSPASYTLANAYAIMGDLKLVIPLASVLLTVLFVTMLRRWRALILLLIPAFAAAVSASAVYLFYGDISGIVIGFSSVLLGITVDYAIHTYLSVQHSINGGQGVYCGLRSIFRPIVFSALTSITAFATLFTSNIEGIRQFAMFGIAGITAGVLASLVLIPLTFKDSAKNDICRRDNDTPSRIIFKRAATLLAIFTCAAAFFSSNVKIDANFKKLGYISEELNSNEEKFAAIWGKMRDFTVIFAVGNTETEARAVNEKATSYLGERFKREDIVTINSILPSDETQLKNISTWNGFWKANQLEIFTELEIAAQKYGFADNSFKEFTKNITAFQPKIFGLETLETKGLAGVTDFFTSDSGKTYITLLYGGGTPQMQEDLKKIDDGITVASFTDFNRELAEIIKQDILMFCSIALFGILFILMLLFRDITKTMSALIPVAAGMAGIFAMFSISGIVMGLFHIVSLPLVIGLAADYGIFMTSVSESERSVSRKGVLLSGLTTAVGFGVLVLATHPSMRAIGVTVLTGITAAAFSALFLIPLTVKR